MPFRRWPVALLVALLSLSGFTARADGANLLIGARLDDDRGFLRRITDGRLAREGAGRRSGKAALLERPLSLTLAAAVEVKLLLLQADARAIITVEGSRDGERWRELWRAPAMTPLRGLRTRVVELRNPARLRLLRLRSETGQAAVSELQAFARRPSSDWPSSLAASYPAFPTRRSRGGLAPRAVNAFKASVAVAAALLALLGMLFQRSLARRSRVERWLWAALGLAGALGWWNLLCFHFDGGHVHTWEVYHYYVGSKYQPELGYTRLYACTALADARAGVGTPWHRRTIRDLRTNALARASEAADPRRCLERFTPARWSAFTRDVAYFRGRMAPSRWEAALRDHGYNATPLWGAAGKLLASSGPASDGQILLLTLIDPLLLAAMFLCIWRAFGWRALCLALVFWGTNYPARFFWNGGAFLRQGWLSLSIISICLLRQRRMFWAGAALGGAALLRVFPALLAVGLVIRAIQRARQRRCAREGWCRWLGRAHRRLLLGGVTALAAALLLTSPASWREFVDNSAKHVATPLTNNMGLKTLLSFAPAGRARELKDPKAAEPYARWKQTRHETYRGRRLLHGLLLAGFILLLIRAVRGQPDWVAATLSIGLIPVATELTCYYYSVLLGYALLAGERRGAKTGIALSVCAALGWLCAALWPWYDELFTWLSAATLAVVGLVTWWSRLPTVGTVEPALPGVVSRLFQRGQERSPRAAAPAPRAPRPTP
jgi:hypothetical protein